MSEFEAISTRELRFPHLPATEDEYVAFRQRKKGEIDVDFEASLTFSESIVVETAHLLHSYGIEIERFLLVLKQPAPQLGVDPEDVYPVSSSGNALPIESARISLEDVQWLSSFCEDTLSTVEQKTDDLREDSLNDTLWLMRGLREFCSDALEFGVRPVIYRN